MQRNARPLAELFASMILHVDALGRKRPVSPGASRKVLERGFAAMLRNNCRPVVLKLTDQEASTLPEYDPSLQGAEWRAAFGFDVDRRATFVVRSSVAQGLSGPDALRLAADLADVNILEALATACNCSGYPSGKWWRQ
jgi:hypothetical protein